MKPFGWLCEEIIGQPAPGSVHEMLAVAEKKFGCKFRFVTYLSNLVPSRSVIPSSDVNMENIDAEIDRLPTKS